MGHLSIFAKSFLDGFGPGLLLSREQVVRPGTEEGFFDFEIPAEEMWPSQREILIAQIEAQRTLLAALTESQAELLQSNHELRAESSRLMEKVEKLTKYVRRRKGNPSSSEPKGTAPDPRAASVSS